MSPTLLTIPRELRDRIYEYVWADVSSVRFTYSSFKDPFCFEAHELRFPEQPAKRYPPPGYQPPETTLRKDSIADAVTAGQPEANEKEVFHATTHANIVEFNLDEFLDEWSDCEEDEIESSDEEEVYAPQANPASRPRYNLESFHHIDTSLFFVNHQLRKECLQYFFSTRNLVFDADGVASMRFLSRLPKLARESIATIAIGSFALQTDDKYSSAAWFGIAEEPEYKDSSGLRLITPFAAFLATQLPDLKQIYLYLPYSGTEDWYPNLAPVELSLLLKYGRIKFLNFVFMGEDVMKTLWNGKLRSRDCYERLMGRFKDCERLTEHEFELDFPPPEMRSFDMQSHKVMMEYVKRRHEYVESHRGEFCWQWAERDVGMGSDGNVQAVVRCWVE